MNDARQMDASAKTSVWLTLFFALSMLLNLYFVVHLFHPKKMPLVKNTTRDFQTEKKRPLSSTAAVAESSEAQTSAEREFNWNDIESTDYRQYIANLRAVGCPEQVIRDIITTDMNQLYTKRLRDVWHPRVTEYWQKYPDERPNPAQLEQITAIQKEQTAMLQELLGVRVSQQELIDTLYLQVQGSEQQLLFLSPEKREAALMALADADIEAKEMKLHRSGGYATSDEQKLFNEKLKTLVNVLTPEELEEFHQRNSPTGRNLKSEIRYLTLTPDEYKKLLLAKESDGAERNTKDIVKKLFGDERATEFERVSGAFYINARTGAEAEGISLDRVDQAAKLANESMNSGLTMAQDKTLSVEERKIKLKELQSQAESRIKELLGDKASQTVVRDLRNVLRSSASYIKP
ncbi:MAG: hypothetical protein ABJC04_09630 [Verrucomicrobiota bacterium]